MPGKFLSKFAASVRSYQRDERGNFAIIAGISAMAMMMTAGAALDYSRVTSARSHVYSALDSSALAAGVRLSSGASIADVRKEFEDFFESNLLSGPLSRSDVTITELDIDPDKGSVEASASARVPLTFLKLTGENHVDVAASVATSFSPDIVEVSMVLDVTGSMRGAKLNDLKAAADDAIDILLPSGAANSKVRIGLVPYSWSVNAGRYAAAASANRSNNCVTERAGPAAYTDASYSASPVGADSRVVGQRHCPSQPILGLTNDRNSLLSTIQGFRADGYTAGHIGLAWGYYMLSENWRPLWRASERPASYAEKVKKIAILMTDGQFNTYYDGVPTRLLHEQDKLSGASAVGLCNDMKAPKAGRPGITIYSIAFQAPRDAKRTLSSCASSPEHFFDATNGEQLGAAFRKIAVDIQKLRLTR